MADRPIIFSAPMVRALLDGRKTQTRRLLSFDPGEEFEFSHLYSEPLGVPQVSFVRGSDGHYSSGPVRFEHDDRLYVRESWSHTADGVFEISQARLMGLSGVIYRADENERWPHAKYWPSIHMPREFSRLTLFVEEVRVERLQSISEADAMAEGVERGAHPITGDVDGWKDYSIIHGGPHKGKRHPHAIAPWKSATLGFQSLWETLHGEDSWQANPFVVALSFRVERGNIDQVPQ